jgi:hypothetical protein
MKIVERKELDGTWWNNLEMRHNSLSIFSRLDYLDTVSRDVCFLVNADNTGGLALPYFVKFGVKTLYTPVFFYFSQWLGDNQPHEKELISFLKNHFQEADYYCEMPLLGEHSEKYPYQILQALHLNSQTKRNLKKAEKMDWILSKEVSVDDCCNHIQKFLSGKIDSLQNNRFPVLNKLVRELDESGKIKTYSLLSGKKIIACLVLIADKNTWFYLKGASTTTGKSNGAMAKLMHEAINYALAEGMQFDFGGSRASGVRQFNLGFGGEDCFYHRYTWSNSPFWYKLIRKMRDILARKKK